MGWCNLSRSQTFAQCNIIFHVTSCAQLGLVRSVDLPGEANGQLAVVKAAVPGHVCHAMCSLQHQCHRVDCKRQVCLLTQALPRLSSRKGIGKITRFIPLVGSSVLTSSCTVLWCCLLNASLQLEMRMNRDHVCANESGYSLHLWSACPRKHAHT